MTPVIKKFQFGQSTVTLETGRIARQASGAVLVTVDNDVSVLCTVVGAKQADPALRDTENIPLKRDIDEYFRQEVLPYAADAWIDREKTKLGYEIPFTRYFYKYTPPRKSQDILAEIVGIEDEIRDTLTALLGRNGKA